MLHSVSMSKLKKNVFAVLDLGSTKISCVVVRFLPNTGLQVEGIGYKISEGIRGGAIIDLSKASKSVLSTVDLAEQVSKETVDDVYVNFSGCALESYRACNEFRSTSHEISDRDVKRIIAQTYEKFDDQTFVVHNIPLRYSLDDTEDVTELRGLCGSRLRSHMHVVTASRSALMNVENCIIDCNFSLAGCIASSYSSGLSCLTDGEIYSGVTVLDIGGAYTSIGVFENGKLVYADSIPIGGIHITRDIACGLSVSSIEAERIKILYGSSIFTQADSNTFIEVPVVSEGSLDKDLMQMPRSKLVKIIRPRVDEVLEMVADVLKKQHVVGGKVVITGGSSRLAGMKEMSAHVLNRQARLGAPIGLPGLDKEYSRNPAFAAIVGSVKLIEEFYYRGQFEDGRANDLSSGNKFGSFKKILSFFGH